MGSSVSSNRRRNNHPRPPPPLSLPPPSVPHQNYSTTPPPLPHQNYPTTPPPPPYNPYHSSHNRNYVNRSNSQPFYSSNQANRWLHVRPNANPPSQQIVPAPYVEHQNAKKVRNDVNVHKNTLRVQTDDQDPDNYLVSFVFDASFDGSITIFYFAKEEVNCRFVPAFPEAHVPVRIPFQKGPGQKFCQPSGTGIDLGFFELDELSKPSPGEDVFPLVIVAEPCLTAHSTGEHDDSGPSTTGNMQITQAVLEKQNADAPFQVRVIKQILWIDGLRYELRELYGIGNSAAGSFNDCDPGKECVICMTEPKDTAVLPCRHMCMCSECAKELRLQCNTCPICRQPIEELIEIKINSGDQ